MAGPGLLSLSAGAGMGSSSPLCAMTSQCAGEREPQHTPYHAVLGKRAQTQYMSCWVTASTTFACSHATRTNGGNQKAREVACCPQFAHKRMGKPPVLQGGRNFSNDISHTTTAPSPRWDAAAVVPALPNTAPPQCLVFHNIYGCSSPLAA